MTHSRIFGEWYDFLMQFLEKPWLRHRRARLLAGLRGRILDVGTGTGINFEHYDAGAEVIGIEPSPWMIRQAIIRKEQSAYSAGITLYQTGCGDPALHELVEENSLDHVVCTLVLCTIPDAEAALRDFNKWLKPGGQLIVLEHIRSHHKHIGRLQDTLRPAWAKLADGCQINRPTDKLIAGSGFVPVRQEWFRVGLPFYEGVWLKPQELVQNSLAESKTARFSPFFTFFQLRSTGYAPSKTQKLTKNEPVFAIGRES